MINHALIPAATLALITLVSAGCTNQALVYGERNSLHVASVQINDNTAEPLRLNVGFRRTIATKAPPLGGATETGAQGDAVSAFSSFNLFSDDEKATTIIDPFVINTKFAAGKAARALASNPVAVAQILNIDIGPDTPAVALQRKAAINCVRNTLTPQQVAIVSALETLKLPETQRNLDSIISVIDGLSEAKMQDVITALKPYCLDLS